MKVEISDVAPGEITRKLPDIVRALLQQDAGMLAEAHDHGPLEKAGARDPEADAGAEAFRYPSSRAMYEAAVARYRERMARLSDDVVARLWGG